MFTKCGINNFSASHVLTVRKQSPYRIFGVHCDFNMTLPCSKQGPDDNFRPNNETGACEDQSALPHTHGHPASLSTLGLALTLTPQQRKLLCIPAFPRTEGQFWCSLLGKSIGRGCHGYICVASRGLTTRGRR